MNQTARMSEAMTLPRNPTTPDRVELKTASDETIRDCVQHADPMVLRGLLYQLTGDESLPDIDITVELKGGSYTDMDVARITHDSDVALIRAKAVDFLKSYRDSGVVDIDVGPAERLFRSLKLTAGIDLSEDERDLWFEQSTLNPWARGVVWKTPPRPEQLDNFTVAVIGTGLSGLNAAVLLKQAGINFVAFEKNSEVGGTWFENRYPGARVDSPSRTYTHIFGVHFQYPYAFCPQEDNLDYMRWVADEFDVRDDIRFNTEVRSMVWIEADGMWELTMTSPTGDEVMRVNAVICCVGFLSRPRMPDIPGMDSFHGPSCHTAQWPDGLDLTGKRVAVVGSGASGYQTTPVIAKMAAHTYFVQRTPSWCYDNSTYLHPLPEQALWLDRNVPYYANFARFRIGSNATPERTKWLNHVDPDFDDPHAVSAQNKKSRDLRMAFLQRKLGARPDLLEKFTPKAPPMSSRPIMVDANDSILDAVLRDDVTVISGAVEEVTPAGIVVEGVEYPVDVIVYATGFRTEDFLWPISLVGRDGKSVEDLWAKDGPRSYIGSMLPGFPNFFMSYGPNSNNFGGFQVIDLLEIEMRFALLCISGLIEQNRAWVDVSHEGYVRYNEELDIAESKMIYMDPRVQNYFRNKHGRSAVNCPVNFRRMWLWLRDPTRPPPEEELDGGLKPYFGGDLTTGGTLGQASV